MVQALLTPLALQRQKFINSMRNNKSRENETMSKYNDFKTQLSDKPSGWMASTLTFNIDSERAYDVDKGNAHAATVGTGANFDSYVKEGQFKLPK